MAIKQKAKDPYQAYLCGFQGLYYKSSSRDWESSLSKESITVCGIEIKPGDKTTLNDFFLPANRVHRERK